MEERRTKRRKTKLKRTTPTSSSERKKTDTECGFCASTRDVRTLKYSREHTEYMNKQKRRTEDEEFDLFDEIPELKAKLVRFPKLLPITDEEEEGEETDDECSRKFIVPPIAETTPETQLDLALSDDDSKGYDTTYSDWLLRDAVGRRKKTTRDPLPTPTRGPRRESTNAKRRLEEILKRSVEESAVEEQRINTTDENEVFDEYFSSDDEQ